MSQSKGATATSLRPCKRYITTHNPSGESVYADSPAQVTKGGIARSYSIASVPADLTNEADIKAYRAEEGPTSYRRREIVNPQPGANLLVVDLLPGQSSAMHRTVSIDYSICVVGEIDHELDGGEKVRLLPGDHIVQRGTMHRWINASKTEPARAIAVTLPCVPFEIAGEQLKEVHIPTHMWDKQKAKL